MNARFTPNRVWSAALGLAGLTAAACPALADHDRHGDRRPAGFGVRVVVDPPVYETRARRVWVEPVYRIERIAVPVPAVYERRTRRVWVPPVVERRVVPIVEPAVYEDRRVAVRRGGRIAFVTERVLVRPARTVLVEREIVVTPGCWKTVVEQVCVRPATTRIEERRVCVREGHWRTVEERVCVRPERRREVCDTSPGHAIRVGFQFGR